MRRATSSALVLMLIACGSSPPTPCDTTTPSVLYIASDYGSTELGALPLDESQEGGSPASSLFGNSLGKDPALAWSHNRRFFIARDLDTFFEADACGFSLNQFSARAPGETERVNPYDVAVAPNGALWVARFGLNDNSAASILVTNIETPQTIDLSSLDADGQPDASAIQIVGTNAFVALDRLTNFASVQPSLMAVLDTSSLKLVNTVTLLGRNPGPMMKETNGALWMAEPGNFFDATESDAGVEVFDTTAMTSSLILKESDLGASVVEVAPSADGTCGAAILAGPTSANQTSFVTFSLDPITHAASNVTTLITPTPTFDLHGVFWVNATTLIVADDRPADSGYPVHVFTNVACVLTAASDLFVPVLPALAFSN